MTRLARRNKTKRIKARKKVGWRRRTGKWWCRSLFGGKLVFIDLP